VGRVYTNIGKADEAIVAFDKAVAADPTKAAAYYWKGVNLIAKETIGKDGKAVAPTARPRRFRSILNWSPRARLPNRPRTCLPASARPWKPGLATRRNQQEKLA